MPEELEFMMEDAELKWLNFSGRATRLKPAGIMTFAIVLDEPTAKRLKKDGWNVKDPKEKKTYNPELDAGKPITLQVEVGYKKNPPTIALINSRGTTRLGQADLDIIDSVRIGKAEVIVRGVPWGPNAEGKSGYKAWLDTLVVHIQENYLMEKYGLNEIRSSHPVPASDEE